MAKKSVITFDRSFPELPGRSPYTRPTQHLVREGRHGDVEIVDGRRPSDLLLVEKIRAAVDRWRDSGWPGATETTRRLFSWWFDEQSDAPDAFRPYWGQREAIETLAYLVEVQKRTDAVALVPDFSSIEGARVERPAGGGETRVVIPGQRDLPASDVGRLAFKMATGSGKTLVMAMTIVWSYFNALRERDSGLSTNFLVLAPNVIVFDRLRSDFEGGKVFRERRLAPPGWTLDLRVILRGDSAEASGMGNLFVTNVQQLYAQMGGNEPGNPVQRLLGKKPSARADSSGRPILERVQGLENVIALNDEAHHVHDEELKWTQALRELAVELPGGIPLWLDFSATPKFQNGAYFPWIVCDYPLAQAVEDGIVKTPTVLHIDREDPEGVTGANFTDKYKDWLVAGVDRLKKHEKAFDFLPEAKPVLFIMCESVKHADAVGAWLRSRTGARMSEQEVLVIHTDKAGDIKKGDLEDLREAARQIDEPGNRVRVVVSVLVLREGWDVRNVTIVLGLRAGTAAAQILPEQAVGRGLRLMPSVGPEFRQVLEVLGTPAFEEFVLGLDTEGVFVPTAPVDRPLPETVRPLDERLAYDIEIPQTGPILRRTYSKINLFDPLAVPPSATIADLENLKTEIMARAREAMTGKDLGSVSVAPLAAPISQEVLATITGRVAGAAKLTGVFATLVPLVSRYLSERCFGAAVDLDSEEVRRFLSDMGHQERVVGLLASHIGRLITESEELHIESAPIVLSESRPFLWRREHTTCKKTVFNLVPTYNPFETRFAEFLDACDDIERFAALAEHFTRFHVDYLKPSGAVGSYFPDWVAVQRDCDQTINWIVETKGREFEGTLNKDAAMDDWCKRVSALTGASWRYLRVNQVAFTSIADGCRSFAELVKGLSGAQPPRFKLINSKEPPPDSIPVYSLEAAAGAFGSGRAVDQLGWVALPGLAREGLFAARVVGKSMEPTILDGHYAVFAKYVGGSREGKVVLAQSDGLGDPETGASYTVKRYTATRVQTGDETTERTKITLQSDNPAVPDIELSPDDEVRVIAVFDGPLGLPE